MTKAKRRVLDLDKPLAESAAVKIGGVEHRLIPPSAFPFGTRSKFARVWNDLRARADEQGDNLAPTEQEAGYLGVVVAMILPSVAPEVLANISPFRKYLILAFYVEVYLGG